MHRAVPAPVVGGLVEHPERLYLINEILCDADTLGVLRTDRLGWTGLHLEEQR